MTPDQQQAIEDLAHRVMDLQEDRLFVYKRFMLRSNNHLTRIIRFSMFGIVVLLVAMIMLIGTFTSRMDSITSYMESMAENMDGMRADFRQTTEYMQSLETAVAGMDHDVASMPSIYHSVEGMGGNMPVMRADLLQVSTNMQSIRSQMASMAVHLNDMDRKFTTLTGAVSGISRDVNDMSRPMSVLPLP